MKVYTKILASLFLFIFIQDSFGQKKNQIYLDYIDKYSSIAVSNQKKYKIPASITLAQAILESGGGTSQLTKKSNNHFGIKCHSDWKGGKVYFDDDNKDDCFRKYKNAEESYKDHAEFLQKNRYSSLFKLNIQDYKGWARGLQKCGYATNKAYANRLIKIIEDYELYRYDSEKGRANIKNKTKNKNTGSVVRQERDIYKTHGLIYVLAKKNDSFDAIADDLGFKVKDLIKYNEVPEDFPLYEGDIVYLQKKKKKADKPYYEHEVQIGESMHFIAQRYGVQLSRLYKMNKKNSEYIPVEGDVLKLR